MQEMRAAQIFNKCGIKTINLIGFGFFAVSMLSTSSQAATLVGTADVFTGTSGIQARVTIADDQEAGVAAGELKFTVEAIDDPNVAGDFIGDLRAVFFHILDESLLPGLTATGSDVTDQVFDANNVIDLGGDANLRPEGDPCPCDFGVEIGTMGSVVTISNQPCSHCRMTPNRSIFLSSTRAGVFASPASVKWAVAEVAQAS